MAPGAAPSSSSSLRTWSGRTWDDPPAYQEILPLRAGHSRGAILLVDGEAADHAATDILGR